jgi:hypothetical protein
MWIVRVALDRPYTFIVLAMLIIDHQSRADSANLHGHFPEHRHPGDSGCLAIHRFEPGRNGRPAPHCLRTEPDDDRILDGEAQQQQEAVTSAEESLQLFTNRY